MGGQGELVLLDGPPASFHQAHGCVFVMRNGLRVVFLLPIGYKLRGGRLEHGR